MSNEDSDRNDGWNLPLAQPQKRTETLEAVEPIASEALEIDLSDASAPSNVDVILGRGRGNMTHPGNQFFQNLVQQNCERYMQSMRHEKNDVAMHVVEQVLSRGGRFRTLDRTLQRWTVLSRSQACAKAGHALRYQRRRRCRNTLSSVSSDARTSASATATSGHDATITSRFRSDPKVNASHPLSLTDAGNLAYNTRSDTQYQVDHLPHLANTSYPVNPPFVQQDMSLSTFQHNNNFLSSNVAVTDSVNELIHRRNELNISNNHICLADHTNATNSNNAELYIPQSMRNDQPRQSQSTFAVVQPTINYSQLPSDVSLQHQPLQAQENEFIQTIKAQQSRILELQQQVQLYQQQQARIDAATQYNAQQPLSVRQHDVYRGGTNNVAQFAHPQLQNASFEERRSGAQTLQQYSNPLVSDHLNYGFAYDVEPLNPSRDDVVYKE